MAMFHPSFLRIRCRNRADKLSSCPVILVKTNTRPGQGGTPQVTRHLLPVLFAFEGKVYISIIQAMLFAFYGSRFPRLNAHITGYCYPNRVQTLSFLLLLALCFSACCHFQFYLGCPQF
jgi:hypothetical protein